MHTEQILLFVNKAVWGAPTLIPLITAGAFFTLRSGFFQFRFKEIYRNTIGTLFKGKKQSENKGAITPLQSVTTALAATLGIGNIAGVATALTLGGAGAIFWMWVSALIGMMTGYAENLLGIYYRKKDRGGAWQGGAMYYIENGLKEAGLCRYLAKPLAVVFALFCVFASLGMGNMTQTNSASAAMSHSFGISPSLTGIVFAAAAACILAGGVKRIGRVTEKLIPVMAAAYTLCAIAVIAVNAHQLPTVFVSIFKGAFGLGAVGGGISGAVMKNAVTVGFKRGIFSNEAGLGSSVAVHAASDIREPVHQGMWSIVEVFLDTVVMCTLTALAVLCSVKPEPGSLDGVTLVSSAFSQVLGAYAGKFVSLAVLLFAFSTVIGWSYFGEKSAEYLFGKKSIDIYKVIYIVFIYIGAVAELTVVWNISDILNALMAIPNLIALFLMSKTVFRVTRNYAQRQKKKHPLKKPMLSAYSDIQAEAEAELFSAVSRK